MLHRKTLAWWLSTLLIFKDLILDLLKSTNAKIWKRTPFSPYK